ncbi:13102_t:CDS:2 [Funneliformis caledonium]|uniref:13102_t:CDS:1 n=1 Tax=Funneliformis caledonium TaxID=1117310 RepID=A0A9N9EYB1_9GLOM|nr:13102_t:CDS:2 [Funneliformis caledonium]
MSTALLHFLQDDYNTILNYNEFSDTEILIGEEPYIRVFKAHSLILKIRSPYLRTALSDNWIKIENDVIKLQIPNISIDVFDIILKYLYTRNLDLSRYDIKTNIALLIAADELSP